MNDQSLLSPLPPSATASLPLLSHPQVRSRVALCNIEYIACALLNIADIGLSNFIIAHKRVARRKLERLELTPFQSSLLSRGVQQRMDDREPKGI